jgi:hypothetical protein
MKIVAFDKTYVDYFQRVYASRRGLTSSVGIRVNERRCIIVVKIGDGPPNICGTDYPLPVDLASLPSHVRSSSTITCIIVGDYLLSYPSSDLGDVIEGKKSFHEALASAAEGGSQRITATGRARFAHSS